MKTNLRKTSKFTVGGYARTHAFGTRVYKVLDVSNHWQTKTEHRMIDGKYCKVQSLELGWMLSLIKVGETNRGNFRFTNGRPFSVKQYGTGHWYYPAKGIQP